MLLNDTRMNEVLALRQKERLDALFSEFVSLKVGSEKYCQCLESIRLEERKGGFSKKIAKRDAKLGDGEKSPLCDFSVLDKRKKR